MNPSHDPQQKAQQEAQQAQGAPQVRTAQDGSTGLRGKTVFITGAASGLGAALAEVLAHAGADIVATDIRDRRGMPSPRRSRPWAGSMS
jgi:NADPH:quinone reductase-like Zn-dependent oxidoreductase